MPIIAKSPPISLELDTPPVVTPTPPVITPTPGVTPPVVYIPTETVIKHQEFIGAVNSQPSCFKREDVTGFSDEEFSLHVQLAMVNKYLIQEQDMFCSRQAVQDLSTKLKRFVE